MNRRPRLGLVAYEYPPLVGGMATYAQALAQHMDARGHEVHVFANEQAGAVDGIHVHPLLTTDLARDLPRLRRFDMDLWHAINFGYAPLSWLKRPFVLTVHGTDFLTPWVRWKCERIPLLWRASSRLASRPARRIIASAALRGVDQVLTCSRFSARLFREEYPSAGRIQVVPNGVDTAFDTLASGGSRAVRHPRRLLTVCNLDVANRRKNVDGCLRAVALVGDRLDLQYWIVGDGPERPALMRLARELNIDERVRFLGRISPEELCRAYASSSLFVLVPRPMTGDVEGFGIVYLEAAACGTPSLAGRWGGAVEAVAEGRSGFFAEGSSAVAIAEALVSFFTGNARFNEDVIRGHARRHAWPSVLGRVERVYERLLARRVRARGLNACETREGSRLLATDTRRGVRALRVAVPPGTAVRGDGHARRPNWRQWVRRPASVSAAGKGGRALLISYMFPPVGGSAVQRPAKVARHLPEWGWSIEVMTAAHDRFPWRDASLLADLPADVRVHRVAGYEPACVARWICSCLEPLAGMEARRIDGGESPFVGTEACEPVGTEARRVPSTDAHADQSIGRVSGGRQGGRPLRWIEDRLYWRLAGLTQRAGWGDGGRLWIRPAVREALRRHQATRFDVVISTGPPHFVHDVGRCVARLAGLPWVADIRDPLLSDFDRAAPDRQHAWKMARLERAVMRGADAVVTTCPSLATMYRERYPERPAGSIVSITNGFDRDDLAAEDASEGDLVEPRMKMSGREWGETARASAGVHSRSSRSVRQEESSHRHGRPFVFAAIGSFYGRREIARIVEPLASVIDHDPAYQGRVRLDIIGTVDEAQRSAWNEGHPDWLGLHGYVPHGEAIRRAMAADCTIVIVPDCRHGRTSVPGKTFELLALPTHLLALVPPGSDTERIVQDAGASTTAPLEDPDAVAGAMRGILAAWRAGRLMHERAWWRLDRYDRRAIAADFARIMTGVCGGRKDEDCGLPVGADLRLPDAMSVA